jgi:hypothetical protein
MGRGARSKAMRQINRALADERALPMSSATLNFDGKRKKKGHLKKEFSHSGEFGVMMSQVNKDNATRVSMLNGNDINIEKMSDVFSGASVDVNGITSNENSLKDLFDKNDFHCWVEDKNGKVVFDPDFKEYELVRKLRGCWDNPKKFYSPFGEEKEKYFWNKLKPKMREKIEFLKANGLKGKWVNTFYQTPLHGYCNLNCSAFVIKNKGKGYKIRVGSMGWLKDPKKHQNKAVNQLVRVDNGYHVPTSAVWWEYG